MNKTNMAYGSGASLAQNFTTPTAAIVLVTPHEKRSELEEIRSKHLGNDCTAQCARLLEAMKKFAITTFEAMRYLDVYHAPARILQLRNAGHKIVTHWQSVETESGQKHRVGLYVLEGKVQS
jgi:hypothetical protein